MDFKYLVNLPPIETGQLPFHRKRSSSIQKFARRILLRLMVQSSKVALSARTSGIAVVQRALWAEQIYVAAAWYAPCVIQAGAQWSLSHRRLLFRPVMFDGIS
jgi:hypothetical protein